MTEKTDWDKQATQLLRAELIKCGLTYDDLRANLETLGIHKTTNNLTKTICGGRFSFAFFLQCAKAMGLKKLQIIDD
ncbi:DUF6471 domain-containing protein [Legionella fairfieldensis]|uniref:DUF6471 domain-containing protein n=1 Tax=Legionella fairfieldensis TaxID=45064 RepID=UPI00048EFE33|nr:DUF6471 domain-containing protein [Legionella fairfieldensis]